jgi:uncharacterized protein (TIGR03437 family)
VNVTIGGTPAQTPFAEAQPGFTGLDQLNILSPRSLVGRGEMELIFTANGRQANIVRVSVK